MSKKIKSLIITTIAIILIVLAYFLLPTNVIQTNISAIKEKILDEELLAGITVSSYVEGESNTVREHRGYDIIGTNAGTDYDSANGKTGIKNETELNKIIADMNNVNGSYPWWSTLAYNTSIFCHERGQPLPDKSSTYLYTFHATNSAGKRQINIDGAGLNTIVNDIVEAKAGKGCPDSSIEVIVKVVGAQEEKETILESNLNFATTTYKQKTRSNVNYDTKTSINLGVANSYILSYSERKMYRKDRAQVALWLNAGSTENDINSSQDVIDEGKKLYHIAKAVEELSNPIKPTMSKGTNTGTIIEGLNYKVGPIKMNDYTFGWSDVAEEYTGKLIAGIIGAEVVLDNDETVILGADNFSFTATATDRGSDCTKTNDAAEVCGAELWKSPTKADGYFYPTPNSEFYILLPYNSTDLQGAKLQGATKIEKITMTYKYITAQGQGWALDGSFDALTWEASLGSATSCTYDCEVCYNDNLSFANKNSHTYICIEPGTAGGYCDECGGKCKGHNKQVCNGHHEHHTECYEKKAVQGELNCGKDEHTHIEACKHVHKYECGHMYGDTYACGYKKGDYDCGKEAHTHAPWIHAGYTGCYSTKYETGNTISAKCPGIHTEYKTCYTKEYYSDYCQHGYKNGDHGTTKASGSSWAYASATCRGTAKCSHGHESCYNLQWKVVEKITKDTQELYAVKKAQVIEKKGSCSISNIPLVAKVEINKYISDVNHDSVYSEYDSTMKATHARATLSEEQKENNPVYVEYGDFVTYTIKITNHSAFGVKVRITDIIPTGDTIQNVYLGSTKKDSIEQLKGTIIKISGKETAVVKVTVKVEKTEGKYANVARLISRNNLDGDDVVDYIRTTDENGPIVNHSSVTITGTTSEPKVESKDYYKLNDYNATINKYISSYESSVMNDNNANGFTDETVSIRNRENMTDNEKQAQPVQVEKGDILTYTIIVKNEAEEVVLSEDVPTGIKKVTAVHPDRVEETLETGLKCNNITAEAFKADDTKRDNVKISWARIENATYVIDSPQLSSGKNLILAPGEYIKYYITVEVTENNMCLNNLSNTGTLTRIRNINDKLVKYEGDMDTSEVNRNISEQQISSDYVKMKDLVIAGKVWLDNNKDGLMNDSNPKQDIIVKLYRVGTDAPIRTTKTDSTGLYTFAKDENGNYYADNNTVAGSKQRIPKGAGNAYYKYYIEYEYDGLKYNSTTYAGTSNIQEHGVITENYKIDSNASELGTTRSTFNNEYEIIAYNKAYKTKTDGSLDTSIALSYTKDDHISELNPGTLATGTTISGERIMTARSFINVTDGTTNYLWLYNQTEDHTKPDTEYLKYINLGLVERNKFDLNLTQDVYEVKTTINGDEMRYTYDQDNTEAYMKGYVNDDTQLEPYVFNIYNSDYYYRVDQYNIASIKDYKGTESELNVETTFKITVKNNSTDSTMYAGINEIVEYYDNNFVLLEFNSDGTVKTFNIKTKDENGYLVNTPVKVVKAEYVNSEGVKICDAVLSTSSLYNDAKYVNEYNALYIRPQAKVGAGEIILAKGQSVDILITFVMAKEPGESRNLIIDDKINVAEINAYSTYYKDESNIYHPAGLVDYDSNPGNFGESGDVLSQYEDDTFKTGITMKCKDVGDDKERTLTGFVWDDARTNTVSDNNGIQYVGDGIYNTTSAIAEAKKNEKVSNNEEKDIAIKDMKVQLVEMIAIPQDDGTVRVYEDVIKVHPTISKMETRTNDSGKYALSGYIPGNYIVKFYYGDDETKENMLIFNGQDYKSTTYQATQATYAEKADDPDTVLAILETANISDAKDDEIRRLESIAYSEIITNYKNTILRGKDSSNKTALVGNTNMESETAQFYVKTEKVETDKKQIAINDRPEKHKIKNIDFGIEYRPELQVSLDKYISNVKITTSDATVTSTPLVKAIFKEYYGIVTKTSEESGKTEFLTDANGNVIKVDKNANNAEIIAKVNAAGADIAQCKKTPDGLYVVTIAGTELDTENSVGLANLQYVENIDNTQGFVYLNIDDEIMQGANISIEYLMVANNLSEIDRVSSNLSNLRFKDDEPAKAYAVGNTYYDQVSYQLGTSTGFIDLDYSGARTARNKLFSEYYEYELNSDNTIKQDTKGNDIIYRIKPKDIEVDSNKKISDAGYYGRYLGSVYYSGVIGDNDVIAELKVDKILDYIDNDLVFNESENNSENRRWQTTTSQELYAGNLVSSLSFIGETGARDDDLVGAVDDMKLVDNKNRAFDTTQRSNLAILLDDRTINKDISKYLAPRYSNTENSYGTVKLVASKIISAEDKSEDMTYDNIAEIVQYSSVTGRVTPLTTTLGNATFFDGGNPISEWNVATKESDTSATEKVTLTPPTGLDRVGQIVRNTVEGASYTLLMVLVVTIVCVGVFVGIRLYRKRPIK